MITTNKEHFNGVDEPIKPQRNKIDLHQFVIKDEKRMLNRDAAEVIREDRDNDRF